ncbi:glycolate oxidase subunit GlcF [Thioclava nitratireducens]|uniref:glycolate oxidase subunit GlcF n=1 Tax=Thioclava nitratireducens TaxID=1915078 RepID=UPI00248153B4|nr:glycolate oxidase subunit GlcF [Thioclava nitratireducens]WGT49420.1 glycolate oxidase subunit GlcF [Thioclava nitratireducens]
MQTNFSPEQLKDPGVARSNEILRACVHCGFCTATCPSYQVLGDELDSPRGRIYLIKDMLENDRPADEKTVKHLDRCLSCLACMTTCPSGVHYMHLIDHARAHVEKTYKRPMMDRLLRWTLAKIVPYPGRFRLVMGGAKLAKPFAGLLPDKRLRAMVGMAPKTIPPVSRNDDAQVFAPMGEKKYRVALQIGCAQRALNTDINDATIRLLRRLGCEVVIPKNLGCCGALSHHMGREKESHAQAAHNISAYLSEGDLDAVIINTSGCGTTVKDYGHIFRNDPIAEDAAKVAGLACDISEFLVKIGLPEGKGGMRVAYHAACSLQHGQQIKSAPKDLLKRAGFEVVEPADSHLCCGSAGTYNLLQPEISDELKKRKVATLEAKQPEVIAAGNIGCMVQIGGGTEVPVVHTVELLDWATGGPKPPALAQA